MDQPDMEERLGNAGLVADLPPDGKCLIEELHLRGRLAARAVAQELAVQREAAARERERLQRAVAAFGGRALHVGNRSLQLGAAVTDEQVLLCEIEHPLDERFGHLTTA